MKQRHLALLIAVSMLAGYKNTSAQYSSVARVDAGGDRALCHNKCFDLNVKLTDVRATDEYLTDSSIDYNNHYPFYIPGSGSVAAENNVFSGAIRLPFKFCFYGKAYDMASIGSNGIISFDDQSIGKRCEPVTKKEIPSRAYAYAAIMPAYEALDLSQGGNIYYKSEGEAPNRHFIVNYNNIPVKGCSGDNATFQVVLYETTNVIEFYIKDKPSCIYYHDGSAISGIQDNHKRGLSLPGKNSSRWGYTGMNAAYRFIPWGDAAVQYVQLSDMSGKIISQAKADNLENGQLSASFGNVCAEDYNSRFIVSTIYNNCDVASTVADTFNVTRSPGCEDHPAEPVTTRPSVREIKEAVTAINTDMPEATQLREVTIGRVSLSNPSTCLGINGSINLHGLQPKTSYTVEYIKNGQQQKAMQISSNAAGALIISKLSAGTYTNIKISREGTNRTEQGPYVLKDPELPATPEPGNNGPLSPGDKIVLSVSNEDKVSYTWLGPGFAAVNNRPAILNAQPYNAGTYTVVATRNGCNSKPATTIVAINNKGGIPNRNVPIRLDHNNKVKPMPATVKVVPSLAVVKQKPKPPPRQVKAPAKQQGFSLKASSNSPVTSGGTLRLHASAINGATYSWNGPNNFSSNAQNPALNNAGPNAAGIYTITVASPQGMLRTAHVLVDIKGVPHSRSNDAGFEPTTIEGISASANDPYVKYGRDGAIALSGLAPSTTYKVHFDKNGTPQPERYCTTDAKGVLLIMWLTAGNYDNIYVRSLKGGRSKSVSAVLSDPGQAKVYPQPMPNARESHAAAAHKTTRSVADIKPALRPAPAAPMTLKQTKADNTTRNIEPTPTEKPKNREERAKKYKGIQLNMDHVPVNGTVTVLYDDPIGEPGKVKWNFGDAVIVSGSGNGPYVLRWNTVGVKKISLRQPTKLHVAPCGDPYTLCKDVYVYKDVQVNRQDAMPSSPSLAETIKQRRAAEEGNAIAPKPSTQEKTNAVPLPDAKTGKPVEIKEARPVAGSMPVKANNTEEQPQPLKNGTTTIGHKSISERHAEDGNAYAANTGSQRMPERKIEEPVLAKPADQPVKKTVTEQPRLQQLTFAVSRDNICLNDTATIMLNGNVPDDAELNWDFADGNIISGSAAGPYVVRWDEKGSKNVTVNITRKNSKGRFSKSVNVMPAPEVHFVMQENACPGEKVLVEIDMEQKNLQQYSWDFDGADILSGSGAGPYEVKWEQPGKKVVSLTVKGDAGCTSLPHRDIMTVHDDCCDIAVPSAFTPNGDGKNDFFRVASVGPHMIVRFVVRNRFGREIFSTNDETQGWDGTLNGAPQQIGTYYYQVRYRCGQTMHEKDGEVMLLR